MQHASLHDIHVNVNASVYVYVYLSVRMYKQTYSTHVCIYANVCLHASVSVSVCVHMYEL